MLHSLTETYLQRQPSVDPFPPETYVAYLQRPDIMKAIGAQVTYGECPDEPYYAIADTGDDARSFLPSLSKVVQSGINVLIWAGDAGEFATRGAPFRKSGRISWYQVRAMVDVPLTDFTDWICNHLGVERTIAQVEYGGATEFNGASLAKYTLNGTSYGEFKTVDNLSYLKVFAAGHEVAYYRKCSSAIRKSKEPTLMDFPI